jgi:NADPH:quinone reductase-like Zn-dependent oxidoreductase
MRAAVYTRYGPPEVVGIAEVDKPAAGDGQVLVKVHATTVNRTDCGYRAPTPFFMRLFAGLSRPRTTVLGTEFAGVVEEVGAGVTSFAVGDRVFGFSVRLGAHAEYLAIRADGLLTTMPAGWTFERAAPGTEGAHYALSALDRSNVHSGQEVLVYGATGAIGSAAVQLLKARGVTVTAVCGTGQVELVTGLGADRVVDYQVEDFTRDEQRYDVVFDAVGKSSFGRCRRLLKPRGSYVSSDLGPFWQNPALVLITPLFRGRKVVFPLPNQKQDVARYLRSLMEAGEFTPVVDRVYPLDQIVEAYRYVETGRKVGSVVVTVVPPD